MTVSLKERAQVLLTYQRQRFVDIIANSVGGAIDLFIDAIQDPDGEFTEFPAWKLCCPEDGATYITTTITDFQGMDARYASLEKVSLAIHDNLVHINITVKEEIGLTLFHDGIVDFAQKVFYERFMQREHLFDIPVSITIDEPSGKDVFELHSELRNS